MLIDKIKNYKLLQKLQKKFVANVAYQGIGTYQDVLDDQGYIKSTKQVPKHADGKLPGYEKGKTVIGSNVDMKDDGTFTDDYTRAFDDLVVTPQGPRVRPGQLHKYQEPWDDEKFMNAVTVGGLNNLSPSQWARRILDFQNGELTVDSWLNGNNGYNGYNG